MRGSLLSPALHVSIVLLGDTIFHTAGQTIHSWWVMVCHKKSIIFPGSTTTSRTHVESRSLWIKSLQAIIKP